MRWFFDWLGLLYVIAVDFFVLFILAAFGGPVALVAGVLILWDIWLLARLMSRG